MMATTSRPAIIRPARPSRVRSAAAERTTHVWWAELVWVGAAAILGFAITAIFAGWLEVSRSWFVLTYAALTTPFLAGYVRWNGIDLVGLVRRRWRWGLFGGALIGAFVVFSVQRQDGGARAGGWELAFDLVWWGLVYGLVDALLLNVLPVLATWRALTTLGRTGTRQGKILAGALALGASVVVTAAYHLGFPEFRGADVTDPLMGDIISLGYLLTSNPLTAVIAHVAMHIAAVLHGAEGTVQLPPHY
jgi:hypothetical protein